MPKNAIENRLDYLTGCWNDFAQNPNARLLRWITDEDGARMIEVFFETQNEDVSDLPDLFVRLNSGFASPREYGFRLAEELTQQFEESRDQLAEEGLDATWRPPIVQAGATSPDAFVACAASFRHHYDETMALLVFILSPTAIGHPAAWNSWLHGLLTRLPPEIRLTFVDRVESPLLGHLAKNAGGMVVTVAPELDMPGAITQLANDSSQSGPGVDFRRLYLQMAQALPGGDMARILPQAETALRIARQQEWSSLEVAVHAMVAAAHSQSGRSKEAASCYRLAAAAAETARSKSDPAGAKLLLQSRLGEAAALLQGGAFREAARVYQDTVPLTVETQQPLLKLESWRMAGYCYAQDHQPEMAWNSLWQALDAAQEIDEPQRRQSTLPYVGRALLDLASERRGESQKQAIHAHMTALMGEEWSSNDHDAGG